MVADICSCKQILITKNVHTLSSAFLVHSQVKQQEKRTCGGRTGLVTGRFWWMDMSELMSATLWCSLAHNMNKGAKIVIRVQKIELGSKN